MTDPLPLDEWTNITVSQYPITEGEDEGKFEYEIKIGGISFHKVINTDTRKRRNTFSFIRQSSQKRLFSDKIFFYANFFTLTFLHFYTNFLYKFFTPLFTPIFYTDFLHPNFFTPKLLHCLTPIFYTEIFAFLHKKCLLVYTEILHFYTNFLYRIFALF